MPDVAISWALTTCLSTTLPSWTANPELVWCPLLDVFTDWLVLYSGHCNPKKTSNGTIVPTCKVTSTSLVPYKITCSLWASSIWDRFPLHVPLQTISKNLFPGGRTLLLWLFTGMPLRWDLSQRAVGNKRLPLLYLPVTKDIQRKESEMGGWGVEERKLDS